MDSPTNEQYMFFLKELRELADGMDLISPYRIGVYQEQLLFSSQVEALDDFKRSLVNENKGLEYWHIKDISIIKNGNVEEIGISELELEFIDMSPLAKLVKLESVHLFFNYFKKIDLSSLKNNTALNYLCLAFNKLESIDLSPLLNNVLLTTVDLAGNKIKSIDLSPLQNCELLREVYLGGNGLTRLDLSVFQNKQNLQRLEIEDNKFKSIDVSPLYNLPNLVHFLAGDILTDKQEQKLVEMGVNLS